jgi:signal transduction histidine kinase
VDPDAPEAHELLANELAKSEYQSAKPTWFDQVLQDLLDWFSGLQNGAAQGPPALGLLIGIIVLAVLVLIAFLVFGLPRINRRSKVVGSLFGEDDARTSAEIRQQAKAAAARGDYTLAVAEMFRAIARGLAERTVLTTTPGTTAHGFAVRAGRSFPSLVNELTDAAAAFDAVRYLDETGSLAQYDQVEALERAVRAAKPILEAVDA